MGKAKRFKSDADIFELSAQIYHSIKDYRQRRMLIPTDPKEIHRRANEIRARLEAERLKAKEQEKINEDLRLIRFDQQIRQAQPKHEPPIRKGVRLLCRTLKRRL